MDIESFRDYCLQKAGATESLPFGPDTLVFKVGEKMFALTGLDALELSINLKCNPDRAIQLREQYDAIKPGYHMSKVHWNTVHCDGSLSDTQLMELIDHSYNLVFNSLSKALKAVISDSQAPL